MIFKLITIAFSSPIVHVQINNRLDQTFCLNVLLFGNEFQLIDCILNIPWIFFLQIKTRQLKMLNPVLIVIISVKNYFVNIPWVFGKHILHFLDLVLSAIAKLSSRHNEKHPCCFLYPKIFQNSLQIMFQLEENKNLTSSRLSWTNNSARNKVVPRTRRWSFCMNGTCSVCW